MPSQFTLIILAFLSFPAVHLILLWMNNKDRHSNCVYASYGSSKALMDNHFFLLVLSTVLATTAKNTSQAAAAAVLMLTTGIIISIYWVSRQQAKKEQPFIIRAPTTLYYMIAFQVISILALYYTRVIAT